MTSNCWELFGDKVYKMKKILAVAVLAMILGFFGCASTRFNVFGIDVNELKSASDEKNMLKLVGGAAASFATHVAGHYLAGEMVGGEIDQQGLNEVMTNSGELSDSNMQWFARGGFVLQLGVNTILTSFEKTRNSYFTKGYTAATCFELWTYPFRWKDEGDFHTLGEYGGNDSSELYLYHAASAWNFYRVSVRD